MRALILKDGNVQFRDDVSGPRPQAGQALIRVLLAGICATDLEVIRGYTGFQGILGHEFIGVVEEAHDEAWVGRRVAGGINVGCGQCKICLGHGPEHCPERTVLGIIGKDGVFADYVTLPLVNLHAVPQNLPDEVAIFTEPLAAAVRIRDQINVRPTHNVAVVGPGRLGMLIGQVLSLDGSPVTMLGRRRETLQLPSRLGLDVGLADDFADNAFDVVVEATGNSGGLGQALRLVRPLGTLVMKSTFHGESTLELSKIVVGEINVVGSRCGPFAPALRLLSRGAVQVRDMIEAEYSLEHGVQALELAAKPGVRKVLLRP